MITLILTTNVPIVELACSASCTHICNGNMNDRRGNTTRLSHDNELAAHDPIVYVAGAPIFHVAIADVDATCGAHVAAERILHIMVTLMAAVKIGPLLC